MRRWLLASLVVASCKLFESPDPVAPEPAPSKLGSAVHPQAEVQPTALAQALADEQPDPAVQREAGGRSVQWWQERLAALRRDGPPDLYELGVQRARANGLVVTVREGGAITVRAAHGEGRP